MLFRKLSASCGHYACCSNRFYHFVFLIICKTIFASGFFNKKFWLKTLKRSIFNIFAIFDYYLVKSILASVVSTSKKSSLEHYELSCRHYFYILLLMDVAKVHIFSFARSPDFSHASSVRLHAHINIFIALEYTSFRTTIQHHDCCANLTHLEVGFDALKAVTE